MELNKYKIIYEYIILPKTKIYFLHLLENSRTSPIYKI